jgi:hypothetical protein
MITCGDQDSECMEALVSMKMLITRDSILHSQGDVKDAEKAVQETRVQGRARGEAHRYRRFKEDGFGQGPNCGYP